MELQLTKKDKFTPIEVEEFEISQSAIKDFYDDNVCKVRWYRQFVLGHEYPPTEVMEKGLYFEHETIGGARGGQEPPEPPRKSNGEMYKAWADLHALTEKCKTMMDRIGLKVTEVQPEWLVDGLVAHPDCLAEFNNPQHVTEFDDPEIIGDLKYTETRIDDRWNGWDDIQNRPQKWVQPLHYVYVYRLLTGKTLPFYYFIFGKSGWVRFYRIRIRQETLMSHVSAIQRMKEDLPNFQPIPPQNYNQCERCNFNPSCLLKQTEPKVEEIII